MKKIKLLFISYLFCQLIYSQTFATVSGKITNPKSNKAEIFYFDEQADEKIIVDTCNLDKFGNFKMSFSWSDAKRVYFYHGDEQTVLFLSPNDNLELSLDTKEFDETIVYKGIGSEINKYNALKELRPRLKFSDISKFDEFMFVQKFDSAYKADLEFLNTYFSTINKNKNTKNFINLEQANLKYTWATYRKFYPSSHQRALNLKTPMTLSDKYNDYQKLAPIDDSLALASSEYLRYVNMDLEEKAYAITKNDSSKKTFQEKMLTYMLELLEKNYRTEIKDFVIASMINSKIQYENDLITAEKLLSTFKKTSKNKKYLNSLEKLYSKVAKISIGKPIAPNFTLKNIDGKNVSLSDFKGKVVYIDFWASWCGPCVYEIPYALKLEEELKDQNIVFVYISFDDKEELWKNAVIEKKLKGVQLINLRSFDSEMAKFYSISGIPRYIIIDKEGRIHDSNAKRPSLDVKKDLESLIKSK
jgi:thiol-disulfide isomerase/thioredoxin